MQIFEAMCLIGVVLGAAAGCSPHDEQQTGAKPGSSELALQGSIATTATTPDAEVVVVWSVGDQLYKTSDVHASGGFLTCC